MAYMTYNMRRTKGLARDRHWTLDVGGPGLPMTLRRLTYGGPSGPSGDQATWSVGDLVG